MILRGSGGLSFIHGGQFEHIRVLMRESYEMTSSRLLTKMRETVKNLRSALICVQRPRRDIYEGVVSTSISKRRKCVEGGGGYVVRDGVCLLTGLVSGDTWRVRAAMPAERSFCRMLSELFSVE